MIRTKYKENSNTKMLELNKITKCQRWKRLSRLFGPTPNMICRSKILQSSQLGVQPL